MSYLISHLTYKIVKNGCALMECRLKDNDGAGTDFRATQLIPYALAKTSCFSKSHYECPLGPW